MPKNSKFIYFDIGGVLMDYSKAMQKAADTHGINIDDFQKIYSKYGPAAERGDMTLQDVWKKYEDELGLEEDEHFDFLEYWTEHVVPIDENHQILTELAKSHPVGILSNMYHGAFYKLLKKEKIPDVEYSRIVQSHEIKLIKPQEEIYIIAQSISGFQPSDIIYIDDRKEFVSFAKTLGWNGIWYEKGNGVNLKTALAEHL